MIALDADRTNRTQWTLLIALCAMTAALGRFVYLLRPFDCDGAMFIYMGKMVAEGGRLGHDLVDNKFPTVGLMTSAAWRLIGVHWWPYIVLDTLLSLGGAFALFVTASRHLRRHAGRATGLFALVFMNFTPAVFGGFQLETPQTFFECLTVYFAVEALFPVARAAAAEAPDVHPALRRAMFSAFGAGLCAGCAAMFKPTGLGVLAAFALAALFRRPFSIRSLVALALAALAGVAIPAAVSLVYLTQTHLLHEMPALYRQIAIYAQNSVWAKQDWGKVTLAVAFLGFPLLCRGWINRRQRDASIANPATAIIVLAITWMLLEVAGVAAQRRMYSYHFMPLMAPTALLFGLLPRTAKPGTLLAAMLPTMCFSWGASSQVIENLAVGDPRMPESIWLADHAKPTDTFWVDAWPRVALETGLHPGARIPFGFLFANYDTAALDYSAMMLRDFDRNRPKYIVLPCRFDAYVSYQTRAIAEFARRPVRAQYNLEGWRRIHQYVLTHYTPIDVAGMDTIWQRKPDRTAITFATAE